MTSSANPDLWSDLSDLSSGHACAALLKVNAEMFAAAPARDRDSIETFEALALGFLPKADRATLLDVARILAPCPDTPPSVRDYLLQLIPEAGDPALGYNPPRMPHARLLATPGGRAHLAAGSRLDPSTAERILVLREAASEDALAANPACPSSSPAFHHLVRRAMDRPDLAHLLLRRGDLTASHEACLYLAADGQRRESIRERIAHTLAPQRPASPCLDQPIRDTLFTAADEGDVACFERVLTEAFGFPVSTEWRILQIGRHPLLALALKSLGLSSRDATRIFLTLHPALSYPLSTLRGLVRETRDVPSAVALVLVETILGTKALAGDRGAVSRC